MAERLALPTSDHGVSGSNPAEGEILSEPKRRFIAQNLSYSLLSSWNTSENDAKTADHPSIHPSKIPRRLRVQLSRNPPKPTQWHARPANYITSLGIHEVWSIDPWLPIKHSAMTLIRLGGCSSDRFSTSISYYILCGFFSAPALCNFVHLFPAANLHVT